MKKEIFETPVVEVTKFNKEILTSGISTPLDENLDWGC